MVTRARMIVLAAAAAACDPGFESPEIVRDLRVLAVQAEPAEVVVDLEYDPMNPQLPEDLTLPEVTVTALVADPGASRRLRFAMVACPPTRSLRCDDLLAPYVKIDSVTDVNVADDPEDAGSAPLAGLMIMSPAVLEAAVRLDDLAGFGGIGVQIELKLWPEDGDEAADAVFASKKVIYAPRVPAGRVANQNPSIAELTVAAGGLDAEVPFDGGRCGDPALPPLEVAPGAELVLEPVEPEGAREDYLLPTFDGGVREIHENLRYAWFATGGSFSAGQTGGPLDFFGNTPPLDSTWTAPDDAGEVRFWLVQRDERGGTSWIERCFLVQ